MRTDYTEVTNADADVAAFVATHIDQLNVFTLPIKMWVARQNGRIVAVLTLKTDPFVSVDLITADPHERAFMRIIKLWYMAESWMVLNNVPIVCVCINNAFAHFQSLVKRLGFEKAASYESNRDLGETIFAKRLLPMAIAESPTVH